MVDSPYAVCGWINFRLANMDCTATKPHHSKIVAGYSTSPTYSHDATPLKHTLEIGFSPTNW